MKYGPVTRVSNVVKISPEGAPLDGFGPVYNAGAGNVGIAGVPLALDYDEFCFQVWDADDVNADAPPTDPPHREQVRYQVYAMAEPAEFIGTPADLLWPAGNPEVNALAGASWDESGTAGDGAIHSFPPEGSINLSGSGLPLSESNIGRNIWFGIRAFAIGEAGAPGELEYTGSTSGTPNTEVMVFKVHEISRPYFVELGSPYQEGAESANDSITTWKPYDNAFGVFFKHGIDPPGFSKEEELEYTLYYSRNEFTANETRKSPLRQDILTKTTTEPISYNGTLDARGYFDADKLMFYVDVGTSTDEYYVYVSVRDNVAPPSSSLNDFVTHGVHARIQPSNEFIEISSGDFGAAEIVGDIQSEGGDLFFTYSNGYHYNPLDVNQLSPQYSLAYSEWRGGQPGVQSNINETNLLNGQQYELNGGDCQLKLCFNRNSEGHINNYNAHKAAVVSFGCKQWGHLHTFAATIAYGQSGWSPPSLQSKLGEENGFASTVDSGEICSYLLPGVGGSVSQQFFYPYTTWWTGLSYVPPFEYGQLRYNISADPVFWPMWIQTLNQTEDYYHAAKSFNETAFFGGVTPDVITSQLAIDPYSMLGQYYRIPDGAGSPGTAFQLSDEQSHLFFLANNSSSVELNSNMYQCNPYSSIMLFHTSDPSNNSIWQSVNLRATQLPGIDSSDQQAGGPNSITVSRKVNSNEGYICCIC
ncbi:MAG: hypothetical protein R3F46_14500 [bacterium]